MRLLKARNMSRFICCAVIYDALPYLAAKCARFFGGNSAPMETPPRPVEKTRRGQSSGEQPGDDANADEERSRNSDAFGSLRQSPGLRLLEDILEGALCDGICRAGACCVSARPRTPRAALSGDEADVWYFTFGANMNAKTLERRGVGTVLQSLAGSLPDYRLAFTFEGYEGCEPRFANIEPLGEGGVPVQGVAHRLSRKQMKVLDGFEGEGSAYERITVAFVAAADDGDVLGETTRPSAAFEVQAYVAMPSHTVPPGLPSKRYVKLLADGAAAHGLAAEYVAAIRAQPSFDCEGIVMPQPPVGARDVSFAELQQHGYRDKGVWVAMGGLVFDVTSQAHARAMLRNMSGGDGTRFVLRMWHAAYGEAEEVARLEAAHSVLVEALPTAQREYVASWAQHLAARYPCVGVLRETRATAAGEQALVQGESG